MDQQSKVTYLIDTAEIEEQAWKQISKAANVPAIENLIVLPDVHTGYELPIGSVARVNGYIWPGAVGYDIGCGMSHVDTGLDPDFVQQDPQLYYNLIHGQIPTGPDMHPNRPRDMVFSSASRDAKLNEFVNSRLRQLGTLGGGNHFIELGVSQNQGTLGITIHSGSRKPGHSIAEYWTERAKNEGINVGGFYMFGSNSPLGMAYYQDMKWAVNFAYENRKRMMLTILDILGLEPFDNDSLTMINESHNHAMKTDGGRVIHRKGATPAETGQWGVIPGNQRDGVVITRGLGNEAYECSASHGAGRTMSRTKAKKNLDPEQFKAEMATAGVICDTSNGKLDEAPGAYKNFADVLDYQEGVVVDIIDKYNPFLVIKG